jgi:hypothetical protein
MIPHYPQNEADKAAHLQARLNRTMRNLAALQQITSELKEIVEQLSTDQDGVDVAQEMPLPMRKRISC